MRRRLFNILSALSLLSCIAAIALWMWSYVATIEIIHCHPDRQLQCTIDGGLLRLDLRLLNGVGGQSQSDPGFHAALRGRSISAPSPLDTETFSSALWHPLSRIGFAAYSYIGDFFVFTPVRTSWRVFIPFWSLTALSAILPLWHHWRHHQLKHAVKDHLCLSCGYDLRASKERCPECGTPIPGQVASSGGTA